MLFDDIDITPNGTYSPPKGGAGRGSLSLYELNLRVRSVLEDTLCEPVWIQAELSSVSTRGPHCYVEFVQKAEGGNTFIAKAKGQIWANKWVLIRPYFEQTTGQPLSAGMQVMVQVEVTFHEVYGYSLNVLDINPTYTLGDIARRRQEILRQLEEEGVINLNKELELPVPVQRIAVISSESAAGWGDFQNQLLQNEYGLAFTVQLFPAVMQGERVEPTIIEALNQIAAEMDRWDVVVIIRGGGATSDLTGFDTLALAENVAQFPLPVITGIGHERDDTVLDIVSHTRVKTPTAAAEFLIFWVWNSCSGLIPSRQLLQKVHSSCCISSRCGWNESQGGFRHFGNSTRPITCIGSTTSSTNSRTPFASSSTVSIIGLSW